MRTGECLCWLGGTSSEPQLMSDLTSLHSSLARAATAPAPLPAAPTTTDPAALLAHMAVHDPVKLALTRELPLVAARLEKTERGIARMEAEAEAGEPAAPPGFAWMHYRVCCSG